MTSNQAVILLVDDDEAKRYLMGTWLRRGGHTVIEAGTGREALEKAGSAELVVLDVNLPDMLGYDVCRQIKADPATAAIPVVQVSATAVQVSDRARGLTQGADAYLTDPNEPEELLAVVMAALRYARARQRAERTAALLSALTGVALDINAADTFDGLARAAAAGAARIFAAQAVLIIEMPDGQIRRTSASPERPEPRQRGAPRGLADLVTARILAESQTSGAVMLSREDWLALVPDSTLRCDVCVAAVRPKPDRPPVAMAVDRAGVPGDEELQVLRQLVQLVALATEALRSYAEEHVIALTLQRSLLPSAPPEIPGLAIAFRYIPASDQAEVGGDFYEALRWRDRVLVAIGDVQGHSLHAATVMGELRHALRAFVLEGHSPLAITGLVNEVLTRYHPGIIATLCLAVLDPASGELQIVNCGHMPPLLVGGQDAAYVGEGGLLLGLPMHEPHVETSFLPPGGTLLLMTDGLVEDRSVFLDVNLEKLRVAAQEVSGAEVEAFSNHLMSIFGPREDDVAMIALRRDMSETPDQVAELEARYAALQQAARSNGAEPGDVLEAAFTELEGAIDLLRRRPAEPRGARGDTRPDSAERGLLRAVFQDAPVPLFLLTRDGTVQRVNRAAGDLIGAKPGYATGRPFTAFVALPSRAAVNSQLTAVGRTGKQRRLRCSLVAEDGLVPCELVIGRVGVQGNPDDTDPLVVAVHDPAARPAPTRAARAGPRRAKASQAPLPAQRGAGHHPPARPGHGGGQAAARERGLQRVQDAAAVRAPDRPRAHRLGHGGHGAQAPGPAAVRHRPGRPPADRADQRGGRRRPAAGIGALRGARVGAPGPHRARRGRRRPRLGPGRRAAADQAGRHVGAVRAADRRRDQVRRADPGPAGQRRALQGGRPGAGGGTRRADGPGDPGQPDVPAPVRHRRGAARQPAAETVAGDPRRADRGDVPRRHRGPGSRR